MTEYRSRKDIRYKGFDYFTSADYFVTVCCEKRLHLFGEIKGGQMTMTESGTMIADTINEIQGRFPDTEMLQSVVMPNHIHILIGKYNEKNNLMDIMRWFKSITTNRYIHGVRERGWQPFPGRLWQRNYYEHIVRNQRSFDYISNYICQNPSRWMYDNINEECKESDNIMMNIKNLELGTPLT